MKSNFIYALISLMLLSACSNDAKYKVAFLNPAKNRPRFVKEGFFMAERLKQLGAKAILIDSDDNDALQLKQGMKALDDGIDLLIITSVNGNTIAPLVREAKKRNVPVIAFDRLINNSDYDLFVQGNNFDNAQQFVNTALQHKPKGNYVVLAGDRFDRNGIALKNGIDSLLKPHITKGDINVVYESYIENWSKENAKYELEQVIQSFGKNIDVIISCNDPMAAGSVEVLQKHNINNVVVTGQDAELEAVQHVYQGLQTMTIYHPHKELGYKTAELAIDILKGKSIKSMINSETYNGLLNIPTVQIKSIAITKDNIGKELVEAGEYTWDEIKR